MDIHNTLKGQLINSYLNQQLNAVGNGGNGGGSDEDMNGGGGGDSRSITAMDLPDDTLLEEFKNQARMWIELDNQIEKLQQAIRDRRALKNKLTEKILRFMGKYNIEDVNLKNICRLRYCVTHVRPPVSKDDIKKRLLDNYGKVSNIEELAELIFARQEQKIEKVSLRRMKATGSAIDVGDS